MAAINVASSLGWAMGADALLQHGCYSIDLVLGRNNVSNVFLQASPPRDLVFRPREFTIIQQQ